MIEIPVGIAASVSFTCLLRHVVVSFFPHHARFILQGGLISSMVTSAAAGLIGIATSKLIAVHSKLPQPPQLLQSSIGEDNGPVFSAQEQDCPGSTEVWKKRSMKTEAVASGSNVKARLFPPFPFSSAHCTRTVKCQDAVRWLEEEETIAGAVFTSLPDVIELDMEGEEEDYKKWFLHVARLILSKLQKNSVAIFYQTDVKVMSNRRCQKGKKGQTSPHLIEWLDKSFLCMKAAEEAGCKLLWRKTVVKGSASALCVSRPTTTHLLCFGKNDVEYPPSKFSTPDIFPRGVMTWPKAIGLDAALLGCRFLKEQMKCELVIDPFCGYGTILACANLMRMDALGIDLSPQKCDMAERLRVESLVLSDDYNDDAYRGQMPKLKSVLRKLTEAR